MQTIPTMSQATRNDIRKLFRNDLVHSLLVSQIQEVFGKCLSVIVIYQKLYIKIKHKTENSSIYINQDDSSIYMIKIGKSFPLQNSVRLYLLDGCYQPKIFDARDLVHQLLGQVWTYQNRLKDIVEKIPELQEKLAKRNQNYLALQKTGQFLLGDVFNYNQLQQHTSLTLFVDKNKQNNHILNAASQTHFLTFERVLRKAQKNKQQQDYETKSKTLYGKKFILSKCCDLQCIQSIQVNVQLNQISLNILKYRSVKTFSQFENLNRKIIFVDEGSLKLFLRIVLKNLPKCQSTKTCFLPACGKSTPQAKQDITLQKIIHTNQMQARLQAIALKDSSKRQQLISRLNKSYQKLIQYYSARANPYYLIYVNKLNWLYNKHYLAGKKQEQAQTKEVRKFSFAQEYQKDHKKQEQSIKEPRLSKSLNNQD